MNPLINSVFVSFLLLSGLAFATHPLEITYPLDDSQTGSDVLLTAVSEETALCEYKLDGGGWTMMNGTLGTDHEQLLSGLSSGEHKVHVHCCEPNRKGCDNGGMNDHVKWDVSAAIPEYPSALMPVMLSIAGFGLVSRKLKK